MRGITMKEFINRAIGPAKTLPQIKEAPGKIRKFPSFHLRSGRKLDLRGLDFDDLLR
jgi:hypothetical protein